MGNAVRDNFISMFISSNLHSETTVPALGSTHPHTFVLYKNSEKKKKTIADIATLLYQQQFNSKENKLVNFYY